MTSLFRVVSRVVVKELYINKCVFQWHNNGVFLVVLHIVFLMLNVNQQRCKYQVGYLMSF